MNIDNLALEAQTIAETWLPDDFYPNKEEIGAAKTLG